MPDCRRAGVLYPGLHGAHPGDHHRRGGQQWPRPGVPHLPRPGQLGKYHMMTLEYQISFNNERFIRFLPKSNVRFMARIIIPKKFLNFKSFL